VREFWFASEGARLFAVEDGDGHVIVMLHGGMADHLAVLPLIAPLSLRFRIVTPDLRGSGKSWSGTPLTFDRLADDVESLLERGRPDPSG
jgi:3-oxoadipate enol-lactonase